jgi:hypothetical protein
MWAGLLLRDLGERHLTRSCTADVTPAMIHHGRRLAFKPASVSLTVHDVTVKPLPARRCHRESGGMSSVLHASDRPCRPWP